MAPKAIHRNLFSTSVVLISLCLLITFQNCNGLSMTVDQLTSMTYLGSADLFWSTNINPPEVNRLNRIDRWKDGQDKGISLFPPLKPGSTNMDMDRSPEATTAEESHWLGFGGKMSLMPPVANAPELLATEFSVLMVIKGLELPQGDPKVLRLFELYPSTGEQAGYLGVDVTTGTAGVVLTAFAYFDGNNVATQKIDVNTEELKGPLAITIRFPRIPEDLEIAVNGRISIEKKQKTGNPPLLGEVGRQLVVHGGSYGSEGKFMLSEFAIWKKAQDTGFAYFSSASAGKLWGAVTAGGSAVIPTPTPDQVKFSELFAANSNQAIFANRCIGCHSGATPSAGFDVTNYTSAKAKSALILTRMASAQNPMPPTGLVPSAELDVVKSWISDGLLP